MGRHSDNRQEVDNGFIQDGQFFKQVGVKSGGRVDVPIFEVQTGQFTTQTKEAGGRGADLVSAVRVKSAVKSNPAPVKKVNNSAARAAESARVADVNRRGKVEAAADEAKRVERAGRPGISGDRPITRGRAELTRKPTAEEGVRSLLGAALVDDQRAGQLTAGRKKKGTVLGIS